MFENDSRETGVEIKNLHKYYNTAGGKVVVLNGLDLSVPGGNMVMIMGPSGSGKTTLLNLIGGIDIPNSGDIMVGGDMITGMKKDELNVYRRENVGFIFQFYNLIPTLTSLENVRLGMEARINSGVKSAEYYLELVGMSDMKDRFPQELSGGQQQRVAIARALAKNPSIVLADEPTGNLDEESEEMVMKVMKSIQKELGITFFIVSHNMNLKRYMDRIYMLKQGRLHDTEGT